MIVLLLLSIVQLSVAAVPMARHQEPMVFSMGGMEDMIYEIPEYDDPHLVDYIMSAMGGSPILSLMHMAKKQPEDKDKYIPPKEKFALAKETLDEVINRLQTIRTRLDKGNGHIHYDDIEKSIDSLKKLERSFRPDIGHLLSAMRQTMSISKPIIQGGILEVRTITTGGPPKMFVSTEKPFSVSDPVPMALPIQQAPVFEPVRSSEPVPTEESVAPATEEVVTEKPSYAMEVSVGPVIEEEEPSMKSPYAMEMYKKTEYKKKVETDDVPSYPRWTWKSSSFV